jgi:hypothetical protein
VLRETFQVAHPPLNSERTLDCFFSRCREAILIGIVVLSYLFAWWNTLFCLVCGDFSDFSFCVERLNFMILINGVISVDNFIL